MNGQRLEWGGQLIDQRELVLEWCLCMNPQDVNVKVGYLQKGSQNRQASRASQGFMKF